MWAQTLKEKLMNLTALALNFSVANSQLGKIYLPRACRCHATYFLLEPRVRPRSLALALPVKCGAGRGAARARENNSLVIAKDLSTEGGGARAGARTVRTPWRVDQGGTVRNAL